jgi:hypothetical protein
MTLAVDRERRGVMRPSTVVAALAVVGLITGAGAAHAATPSRTPVKPTKPCSVLDSATIGEIATQPVRAGRDLCRWFVTGAVSDMHERTVVLVSLERYEGRARSDIAENSKKPSAVRVTGLAGAKISFYDLKVVPPTITVVTGKVLFVVQMHALDGRRATVKALEGLAGAVLANL